jgi:uncharacterized flavoprotein (TIGR03862 family)
LNLTHSEPADLFRARYREAAAWMAPILAAFPPQALIGWCEGLGQPTFVGSSGRIFPRSMKASPLLRAWIRRLEGRGVRFVTGARWTGWNTAGALTFEGGATSAADAVVLALGGASWPRLGADGGWMTLLPGVAIAPLRPANCGFGVDWSPAFRDRHAGAPLKRIALSFSGWTIRGEAAITAAGIEGGIIYAMAAPIRDALAGNRRVRVHVDLRPDLTIAALAERLDGSRGSLSLSTYLHKRAGLPPVAVGLVQEALHAGETGPLAALIKAVPITLTGAFGLARAISTAGGIALGELDDRLMLRRCPGVFAAGEMLDWEAPTGGYLLQACMATGFAAGTGVLEWLRQTGCGKIESPSDGKLR